MFFAQSTSAVLPAVKDNENDDDRFRCSDLQNLFNDLFFGPFNTQLVRGEGEPLYLPADESVPYHRVIFAHGYFASALHEVAHWCIAGEQRRQHVDYKYWYVPDGRTARQQAAFEQVEVKPQALEWLFTQACGRRFHPSADNLAASGADDSGFRHALLTQVYAYCEQDLPSRARDFRAALCAFYGIPAIMCASDFSHSGEFLRAR